MSRSCEICEKSSLKGRKITKIWGVKYKSIKHRLPNLRNVSIKINGIPTKVKICTKCLKSIKNGKIDFIEPINDFYKKSKSIITENKD